MHYDLYPKFPCIHFQPCGKDNGVLQCSDLEIWDPLGNWKFKKHLHSVFMVVYQAILKVTFLRRYISLKAAPNK